MLDSVSKITRKDLSRVFSDMRTVIAFEKIIDLVNGFPQDIKNLITQVGEVAEALDTTNADVLELQGKYSEITQSVTIRLADMFDVVQEGGSVGVFYCPKSLDGWYLSDVQYDVETPSEYASSYMLRRYRTTHNDMLTTAVSIDAGEVSSVTSTTPPVIASEYAGISIGDRIYFDKEAGDNETGDTITLIFTRS